MTLLAVCQSVAKDCGFAVPTAIVGNEDDTAVQLLALANRGGKAIARKPWQALQKEHTFATVNGTANYDLPSDYGWYLNDTAWDRTEYWQTRGSLSPQEWQVYKSGIGPSSPRSRFRLKGGSFYIDPTPSSARNMVIEYVSNKWVFDGSSGYATEFTDDDEVPLFDEYLLQLDLTWRFLKAKGLAYADDKADAEAQIELSLARDTPSPTVSQAGNRGMPWPPLPHWRGTGVGS